MGELYKTWGVARAWTILALVVLTLIITVIGYCHTFEMDYAGPDSEIERSRQEYKDNENERPAEKCARDTKEGRESSRRDQERAAKYERDHGA